MKRAAARLDSWIHGFVPVTPEGLANLRAPLLLRRQNAVVNPLVRLRLRVK